MRKLIGMTAVIAGLAGIAQATYVQTFDTFALGTLTAQENWAANTSAAVVATASSGNYSGGQALASLDSTDKTLTGTNLTFGLAGGTNVIEYGFDFNTTNTTAVSTKMRLSIINSTGVEGVPSPSFGLTNGSVNIRVAGETGTDYITGNNLAGSAYYSTNPTPASGQWTKGDWIRLSLQLTGAAGSKFTNATITAFNLSRGWFIATGVTDVDLSGYTTFNTTNSFNAIRIRNTIGGVSIDNAYVQSFKSSLNFGATSNTVPYQETFEEMAVGSPIVVFNNTNGWYNGTNTGSAFVTNVSYELNNLLHPVESAAHSNVLKFTDASLINRIQPYSAANTTVDFMLQSALGEIAPNSSMVPGSQTALYLNADGRLKAWYGLDNTGTNNAWLTYANTPVGTADWVRVTIALDYTTDAANSFFKVMLDGVELRPPTNGYTKGLGAFNADPNGTWLLIANQALKQIQSFAVAESGMLDDLVVTTNDVTEFYPIINHLLTVTSGTGGGSYTNGYVQAIEATVIGGKTFASWTGDTVYLTDSNSASTTVTMPAQAVSLTATYVDTTYALTVTSGSNSGPYTNGQQVAIVATGISGKTFVAWTGDTQYVDNASSASATVTMPAQAVNLTATYTDTTYALTVNNGNGGGLSYTNGQQVAIYADPPSEGKVFDKWTGDTQYLDNASSSIATVTMPAQAVNLTATYVDITYVLTVTSGTGGGSYTNGHVQ
ncbi:MAG: hypothetical protein WCG03_00180, partial [Kiritimatiellales bacterium]